MSSIENMTDDELMKLETPPAPDKDDEPAFTESASETLEDSLEASFEAGDDADPDADGDHGSEKEEEEPTQEGDSTENSDAFFDDKNHTAPHQSTSDSQQEELDEKADGAEKSKDAANDEFDYKGAYERLTAPFKANGREYTVQSPEEATRLMQMGANYTKKMQSLAPNLKMMRMLENNGLLTEEKLSFLIDLDKKDPNAIQKLLHDGNIDPLDLNADEAPTYQPGNHTVSDDEQQFHTVLEDVASTPTGKETISVINAQWDQTSKEAVYREPQIMQIIDVQRGNGIYDAISAEIDRQKMFGNLSPNMPFIEAYKTVGDQLQAAGKLTPNTADTAQQQGHPAPRQVVETRTSQAPKADPNGDQARAAAAARSGPKSKPKAFDVFAMSDEEIMAAAGPKF